jgi:phosphoribosylanthranilate isomerase
MGFIFYELTPRFAGDRIGPGLLSSLPVDIRKTGVFVDAPMDYTLEQLAQFGLNAVQLHGNEGPEYCKSLKEKGYEVIKVFSIRQIMDVSKMKAYQDYCDLFLFDTAGRNKGGSGMKFNWTLLQLYSLEKPYFLSGGISPEDGGVIRTLQDTRLYGVDINSRFEVRPGVKDLAKIKQFVNDLKTKQHGT